MNDYAYNNITKPLLHHKKEVWYDDSKNINKLDELANLLGFKALIICGEKDDESDIAKIKTDNRGTKLILENCHLRIVIKDDLEGMMIKDNQGQKTIFKRGEDNVI